METLGTVLGWLIIKYAVASDGEKTMVMYNRSSGNWSVNFSKECVYVSQDDAQKTLTSNPRFNKPRLQFNNGNGFIWPPESLDFGTNTIHIVPMMLGNIANTQVFDVKWFGSQLSVDDIREAMVIAEKCTDDPRDLLKIVKTLLNQEKKDDTIG